MNNVEIKANGSKLVVTIDCSDSAQQAAPLSSTGKTRLLASTGGAFPVNVAGKTLKLAVNVLIPR